MLLLFTCTPFGSNIYSALQFSWYLLIRAELLLHSFNSSPLWMITFCYSFHCTTSYTTVCMNSIFDDDLLLQFPCTFSIITLYYHQYLQWTLTLRKLRSFCTCSTSTIITDNLGYNLLNRYIILGIPLYVVYKL